MNLEELFFPGAKVDDLEPLAGLLKLKSLNCGSTKVADLSPLSELYKLEKLCCSFTKVTNLGPLKNLRLLHELKASKDPKFRRAESSDGIIDLTPVANLKNLTSLCLANNDLIDDLTPIANLRSLEEVDIRRSSVTSLKPLEKLQQLKAVNAFDCKIEDLSVAWVSDSILEELMLGPHIPGMPAEVLSESDLKSCLWQLRSHIADLGHGAEQSDTIKILVLGNGRVGKTQVVRRLRGLAPEIESDSTHGIVIAQTEIAF